MPQIIRSALVPYSAEQMFALVNDVEAYPEFFTWMCEYSFDRAHRLDHGRFIGRGQSGHKKDVYD